MLAGDDPLIGAASGDQTLYGITSASLWAEVTTTGAVAKVWAVITKPDQGLVLPGPADTPELELVYSEGSGRYEGTYAGFTTYGTYKIAVYAMDGEGVISQPAVSNINQKIGPDAFEDDDDYSRAAAVVLDDPEARTHNFHDEGDRDWVEFYAVAGESYEFRTMNLGTNCDTVLTLYARDGITPIASNDDYEDKSSFISWRCLAEDGGDGTYYIMVKQYADDFNPPQFGPNTNYDLRAYRPTAPEFPGILVGQVRDVLGNGIEGALVSLGAAGGFITLPGGYYMLIVPPVAPPASYTMTITADGFDPAIRNGVLVSNMSRTVLNVTMERPIVDINGDGLTGPADVIIALRMLSNLDVSGLIREDYNTSGMDIFQDNRIGLEEVIYILQSVGGLR
jgi:hypothetical protein